MAYEKFEKDANIIIKRIIFIIFGIIDILAILIMICGPEFTLGKFVIGIFSLIGFNYVMLKVADLILFL